MILKCPKCAEQDLVNAPHGASRCPACGGMFVPMSRVRELDAVGEIHETGSAPPDRDKVGGRCPADRSIMSRSEIHLGSDLAPIHLERCSSCLGVWFDAGEWSMLSDRHLLDHIDEFWSAEWRSEQRRGVEADEYQRRLTQTFGPELYAQIQSLAVTLRDHPRRSQALAVLREESSGHGRGK